MDKDNITVKELIEALSGFPDDAFCVFDMQGVIVSHRELHGCGFISRLGDVVHDNQQQTRLS